MPDLAAAVSTVGALKAAADLAQSLISLTGSPKVREQAVKLYGEIIASQKAEIALVQEKRHLESEVASLEEQIKKQEDWNRERERYELTRLCPSAESFAFKLKPKAQGNEVDHALCPHCFENHKKRVLSGGGSHWGTETLTCHDCKFTTDIIRPFDPEPMVIQL